MAFNNPIDQAAARAVTEVFVEVVVALEDVGVGSRQNCPGADRNHERRTDDTKVPLVRRLPYKRGFKNPGRVEYQVVNLVQLAQAPAGGTIDREWLKAARLVRRPGPIAKLVAA